MSECLSKPDYISIARLNSLPNRCVRASEASDFIYRPKPNDDALIRLFCFPYAGAGAAVFRLWPNHLPEYVDVVSIHAPGRAHRLREAPLRRVDAIVELASICFLPLLDRPFALFGHSLGAIVAAEFARLLLAQGQAPLHLFVSSRPPKINTKQLLYRLPDSDFIAAINERYQGIPQEIMAHADLLTLLLPALRADFEALETFDHVNRAKLTCPTTVYGGASDQIAPRAELEGWNEETVDRCRIRMFPGDHFYLNTHSKALLADVSATLEHEMRAGLLAKDRRV